MSENHSFNTEFATRFGIEEAIIFDNIYYWCMNNMRNNINAHALDGDIERYWTFNSCQAMSDTFTYITPSKIRRVVKKLEELGFILIANFNKAKYDHTNWYAVTELGENTYIDCCSKVVSRLYKIDNSILQNVKHDFTKCTKGSEQNVEPIPNSNTTTNTNSNLTTSSLSDSSEKTKSSSSKKSTTEKIQKSKTSSSSKKQKTEEELETFWCDKSQDTRKKLDDITSEMYRIHNELDSKYIRTSLNIKNESIKLYEYMESNFRTVDEISNTFRWAMNDNFWKPIVCNVTSFIRNYEKLVIKAVNNKSSKRYNAFEDKERVYSLEDEGRW